MCGYNSTLWHHGLQYTVVYVKRFVFCGTSTLHIKTYELGLKSIEDLKLYGASLGMNLKKNN